MPSPPAIVAGRGARVSQRGFRPSTAAVIEPVTIPAATVNATQNTSCGTSARAPYARPERHLLHLWRVRVVVVRSPAPAHREQHDDRDGRARQQAVRDELAAEGRPAAPRRGRRDHGRRPHREQEPGHAEADARDDPQARDEHDRGQECEARRAPHRRRAAAPCHQPRGEPDAEGQREPRDPDDPADTRGHDASGRAAPPSLRPVEPLAGEPDERHGESDRAERERLAERLAPRGSRAFGGGRGDGRHASLIIASWPRRPPTTTTRSC